MSASVFKLVNLDGEPVSAQIIVNEHDTIGGVPEISLFADGKQYWIKEKEARRFQAMCATSLFSSQLESIAITILQTLKSKRLRP